MSDYHITGSDMKLIWVAGPTTTEALRNLADALDELHWADYVTDLHFLIDDDLMIVAGAFVEVP